MKLDKKFLVVLALVVLAPFLTASQEKIDYKMIDKIRDEGFNRSQVMGIASYMTDVLGPRFSNSPGYTKAAEWAKKKFEELGIKAELEAYGEIGPGWENRYTSVHMHKPQYMTLIAYPKPYSRGTEEKVISEVVFVNTEEIFSKTDLEKYNGKLRGKIIFTKPKRKLTLNFDPATVRLSKEELDDMAELKIFFQKEPAGSLQDSYSGLKKDSAEEPKKPLDDKKILEFFEDEGVAAIVEPGGPQGPAPMDKGLVHVSAPRPLRKGQPKSLPTIIVSAEHYNRIMRILEWGIGVEMEVETWIFFEEDDLRDFNVIAEIPGSDLKDEIVMIGGHYDGEPSGTGATDNASGCAAVMEAMRILKAVGVKPRRTIRAALWGCEEAGHLGSKAYVEKHFGGSETQRVLPDHDKLSVYFNMDWYGRFRGIYLQGNDLVRPIFEEWMKPFHDVGMTHIVPGNTGGTDHMDFVRAGLPGFQFIQDDLEFFTTTFHTNMDVYDRLVPEDLMQASVILASFAYNAAMRDQKLPRTPNQMTNNRRWHK
ncbi:MAG: M20/M25/M40 family metallo-hydrolase [Candidatus Aminicenantes bacterium]|nr:MAG: M20/M25/M40 family metallo-hydrolase [Candidatus Aminicenantes bacterium]